MPVYLRIVVNGSSAGLFLKSLVYYEDWILSREITTACYMHYSGNQYPFDIDTSCRGSLDMAWRYFQQMYKALKADIINTILGSACNAKINIDETKHHLNFPDKTKIFPSLAGSPAAGTDSLTHLISNTCAGYVKQWWKELAPCNYTTADSLVVFPRLIKVCTEGGDMSHPFGASTVKPSSGNHYRSFQDVINGYNDSLRTAPVPRNLPATSCNGLIISAPAAYDNRSAYGNADVWNKPDSCQCSIITALYNSYLSAAQGDASFSAYLLRTAGTQISNAALDSLRSLCNGTITCRFLTKPISVPPVLQCGVKDVCATCAAVANLYSRFKSTFPTLSPLPSYDNSDSLQRASNTLFENFMNYNLGFSKRASDYLTFIDTCGNNATASSCDTLAGIQYDYISNASRVKHPDASGCDTTNWKIDFGGVYYNVGVPLGEIFKNGVAQLPYYYTSGLTPGQYNHVDFDHINDTLCIDSAGFTFDIRLKLPDSLILSNGNGASWWIYLYTGDLCGWIQAATSPMDGQGVAMCTHAESNDPLKACSSENVPGQHFNDWGNITIKVAGRTVSQYVNNVLLAQRTLDHPVTKLGGWTITQWATQAQIDYIHITDANGKPLYMEDFNGCSAMAYPVTSANCNCQQAFTDYFNQRKGSGYTYAQISALYAGCGVVFAPCSDTSISKLKTYKDEFVNNYFNYGRKYDANGCDTVTWKVDYGSAINQTGVAHNKIFHDGIMQFPDTLAKAPNPGSVDYDFFRDSACIGGRFAVEFRMKDIVSVASNSQILVIDINLDNRAGLTKKYFFNFDQKTDYWNYAAYYDYTGTPGYSREYFNLTDFKQVFGDWKVVKLEFIDSVFKFYVNGTLLRTFNFPANATPQKVNSISFRSGGDHKLSAAFDYIKMYDGSGVVFYQEDFNDCSNFAVFAPYIECPKKSCSAAFTDYYNQAQSTHYIYSQIDSIYRRYGVVLNVCPVTGPVLCGKSDPVFPPATLLQHSSCDDSTHFAVTTATMLYKAYMDSLNNTFNDRYLAKCLNAYKAETFTVTQPMSEFHYTLYYYDQAGNLVRTIPPEGVDMSVFSRTTYFDSVKTARNNGTVYKPRHQYRTDYRYNSLNQVATQATPDAGLSSFWYDRLGRLVISQNARQKAISPARQYSYTQYDYLGRINEVGQLNDTTATGVMTDLLSRNGNALNSWLLALSNKKEQVTRTFYDLAYGYPLAPSIPLAQANLRNRVSYTSLTNDYNTSNYNAATFYSYDIHGNVDTLLQGYGLGTNILTANIMNRNANQWERMVYQYDLISGKVNQVAYNPGYYDVSAHAWVTPFNQFYHRYSYDAENRLTTAETSSDSINWATDARYEYYRHGPLARMLLGDQLVQGVDYAYTLEGWLKGVNSTAGSSTADMGADGRTGGQNINIARDLLGYNLNYYPGDYTAINSSYAPFAPTGIQLTVNNANRPLYNGNIASMAVSIKPFNKPYLYNYRYDQLNRLTGMDSYTGLDTAGNSFAGLTFIRAYNERVSYDGNGNIKKYNRYFTDTSNLMDKLTYNYLAGTNKLTSVRDSSSGGVNANYKIKNQAANNYAYDEIGNLIKDSSEYIPAGGIKWNVYGRITEINHSQAGVLFNTRKINYTYDAAGNRIGKKVVKFGSATVSYTWYVRDAGGNVLGVYTAARDTTAADTTEAARLARLSSYDLIWAESPVYGSSRLGVQNQYVAAESNFRGGVVYEQRGYKFYELTNHLGNVLGVVTDKKIAHTSNGTTVDYYNPDVVSVTDYYPFGMTSRSAYLGSSSLNYRYSFNGKENDRDVKGDGDQIDYGLRVYDPRLGRFLSMDPLAHDYPWYTPYQFAGNKPIQYVDLDGAEETLYGAAKEGAFGKTGSKIVIGSIDGIQASLSKTWSFLSSDMWKASTWKKAASALGTTADVTVGNMDGRNDQLAQDLIQPKVDNFKKEVVNGDAYSRSKYFGEVGTDIFTAYAGSKGLGIAGEGLSKASSVAARYMSGRFILGAKTLAKVTAHLEGLGFGADAGNQIMLSRMQKIVNGELKATEIDVNFAKHELRESELVKAGKTYEEAHTAVLKEQNMYHLYYEKKLYTQEALDASNAQWEKEVKKGKE